jgi:hypothetical protein
LVVALFHTQTIGPPHDLHWSTASSESKTVLDIFITPLIVCYAKGYPLLTF